MVTVIQFSTSLPEECERNMHSHLEGHELLTDTPLQFRWMCLSATKWTELAAQLEAGELRIGGLTASLAGSVDLASFKSTISYNGCIKNPTSYPMFQDKSSSFPGGMFTPLGNQLVGVVHGDAVRQQLNQSGFDRFIEVASLYLGAYNDPGEPSLLVIIAPVPAMIGDVKVIAENHRIGAHVLSHPKLKGSLSLKGYVGSGNKKAPRFGELSPCEENQAYAEAAFEPNLLNDDIELRLVHNILGIVHTRSVSLVPNVEGAAARPESEETKLMPQSREIFVVHGRNGELKESVARVLEKLDLIPIILHEQPNKGCTLIEKFEAHSSGVRFAVVLLTADDLGGTDKDNLQPRARQNVILELGYFLGALGRERVCALYKPGVELPSDIHGLLWINCDQSDWKLNLAKEIAAVGIEVDLNKL